MAKYLATIRTCQKVSICERNRNPDFGPFITDETFASAIQKKDGRQGEGLFLPTFSLSLFLWESSGLFEETLWRLHQTYD
jgi:hypothetical protein